MARGNAIAEAELPSGRHYLVVDTFEGDAQAGAYVLHVHAIGEEWLEMPVAQGVTWRARRASDLGGVPQVVHALRVELDAPGIDLQVVRPPGCATVAQTAAMAGPTAVAAINSSFFSGCGTPVSFMKDAGVLLATNGADVDRGAFGLDAAGLPMVGRTGLGADWPEAVDGQGGIPLLAQDGVPLQGAEAWAAEGLSSPAFLGPNPRTVIGYDAEGDLLLATVDGRRPNATGMSLDALAAWSVDELGGEGVVNLDGGGSTTMWIAGVTPSGVVNYPSDGGMLEQPDHGGSRAVVGAVVIHGLPYDWPPRFQTEPGLEAAVGVPYQYDADAIDLDVDDVVSYAVVSGPAGLSIDASSGVVDYLPALEDPPMIEVIIEASDGTQATAQAWTLVIDGAVGPGEDESGGAGSGDAGSSGGGPGEGSGGGDDTGTGSSGAAGSAGGDGAAPGCGCRSGSPEAPWWSWLLLAIRGDDEGVRSLSAVGARGSAARSRPC